MNRGVTGSQPISVRQCSLRCSCWQADRKMHRIWAYPRPTMGFAILLLPRRSGSGLIPESPWRDDGIPCVVVQPYWDAMLWDTKSHKLVKYYLVEWYKNALMTLVRPQLDSEHFCCAIGEHASPFNTWFWDPVNHMPQDILESTIPCCICIGLQILELMACYFLVKSMSLVCFLSQVSIGCKLQLQHKPRPILVFTAYAVYNWIDILPGHEYLNATYTSVAILLGEWWSSSNLWLLS